MYSCNHTLFSSNFLSFPSTLCDYKAASFQAKRFCAEATFKGTHLVFKELFIKHAALDDSDVATAGRELVEDQFYQQLPVKSAGKAAVAPT